MQPGGEHAATVRTFVGLTFLAQLSKGILLPVWLLLALARGLDVQTLGLLVAVVAVVTAVLELPTGGLADVLGRRPVLVVAAACSLLSFLVLGLGPTSGWLFAGAVLVAVSAALTSGPLDAWFVDEVNDRLLAEEREAVLTRGFALAASATGFGLAGGGLLGSGLTLLAGAAGLPSAGDGVLALSAPLLVAAVVVAVELVALARLLPRGPAPEGGAREVLGTAVRDVPGTVVSGVRLAVLDPVLRWFSLRWLLVPIGFLAFELLTPLRLEELLGDPATATALMGPMAAGCFLGVGVAAALAPRLRALLGPLPAAAAVTVGAGACFALAGQGGVGVLLVGVLAGFLVSGPVNPLLMPMVHERVDSSHRATLLSVRSLLANLAVAAGAVLLGIVTDTDGTSTAFAVAGALTVLAALPLLGVAAARNRPVSASGHSRPPPG